MKKKKNWKITAGAAGAISAAALVLFPLPKALADTATSDSFSALADIRTYTNYTYQFAEKINANLTLALVYLNEWLITPDASNSEDSTGRIQSDFANYTNTILSTTAINNDLQASLTREFLGDEVNPATAPFINDVTYQTLLGLPYFNPDPRRSLSILKGFQNAGIDPARNYVLNAAGLNIKHILPRDSWKGSDESKQKYRDFYNTVSSIQTFNIHVLGELYADYKSGGAASSQQTSLIQQASSSSWFSVVASEHIGLVLRQILMYNSQLLVVATQILQVQKELLAGQAMTNTLMVLGNQFNENLLLNNATGKM